MTAAVAAPPGLRRRVVIAVAALAAMAALLSLGFLAAWKLKPEKRQEIQADTVVTRIRRIAKLATIEAHEAQIVKVDEGAPVLYLFESRKNAILLVRGKVVAGVDLERARIQVHEDAAGRTLEVELPPAEIIALDPTVQFYEEKEGWLNPITPEDRTAWLKLARVELRKAAVASGILDKAEAHARTLVEELGSGLGFRVVVTGPGGMPPRPSPELPDAP